MSTPSIADADRIVEYPSANGTGPYAVPFPVFEETGADLYVTLDGEEVGGWTAEATVFPGFYGAPNTYLLELTFDESISGHLVIEGRRAPRRVSQYVEGRGIPARDHNAELNTLTAIARETFQRQNRFDSRLGEVDEAVDAAETSAGIAGDARDEAISARDDVFARYLGELAEDPDTRLDGSALQGGEWYVRPDGTQRVYASGSGTWSNAPQGPEGGSGDMPEARVKGRATGAGSGPPADLDGDAVRTITGSVRQSDVFGWVDPAAASEATGTITCDLQNGAQLFFTRTMAGNETLAAPSNAPPGATFYLLVTPGANTLSFATGYEGPNDALPNPTTETLLAIVVAGASRFLVHVVGSDYGDGT